MSDDSQGRQLSLDDLTADGQAKRVKAELYRRAHDDRGWASDVEDAAEVEDDDDQVDDDE
jgi:hypothetical protein